MTKRRYPIGAEIISTNETHFRVWAPKANTVDVVVGNEAHLLTREAGDYFSGMAPCRAGARYKFRLNAGDAFPDPASRSQPDGPHGASCVVDPFAFSWNDQRWSGP